MPVRLMVPPVLMALMLTACGPAPEDDFRPPPATMPDRTAPTEPATPPAPSGEPGWSVLATEDEVTLIASDADGADLLVLTCVKGDADLVVGAPTFTVGGNMRASLRVGTADFSGTATAAEGVDGRPQVSVSVALTPFLNQTLRAGATDVGLSVTAAGGPPQTLSLAVSADALRELGGACRA
jgi:hypothetical protein